MLVIGGRTNAEWSGGIQCGLTTLGHPPHAPNTGARVRPQIGPRRDLDGKLCFLPKIGVCSQNVDMRSLEKCNFPSQNSCVARAACGDRRRWAVPERWTKIPLLTKDLPSCFEWSCAAKGIGVGLWRRGWWWGGGGGAAKNTKQFARGRRALVGGTSKKSPTNQQFRKRNARARGPLSQR